MTPAVIALLVALLFPASAFAGDIPYLTGRVVDNAQILSPDARTRLAAVLKAHEEATSNQIVGLFVGRWVLGRRGQFRRWRRFGQLVSPGGEGGQATVRVTWATRRRISAPGSLFTQSLWRP
jgi:hypothetical protein